MKVISKNHIINIIFAIIFTAFTVTYFSFFPGSFSFDSYLLYSQSLHLVPYTIESVPLYTIIWSLFNNFNYGPFIANYLLILLAVGISYKKTKSLVCGLAIYTFLLIPSCFTTYIYAWKDTALISVLFLVFTLLLKTSDTDNKPSKIIFVIIWVLLFFATNVRLNAIAATLPILYYIFSLTNKSQLMIIIKTGVIISTFWMINNLFINQYIYKANSINGTQSIYFTDIVKMNFYGHLNIDIPQEFRSSNYTQTNINNIMAQYRNFSCNDIFYMPVLAFNNNAPINQTTDNTAALHALRTIWLATVIHHPMLYFKIRISQLYHAISSNNIPQYSAFNTNGLFNYNASVNSNNKFYTHSDLPLLKHIRNLQNIMLIQAKTSRTLLHYLASIRLWLLLEITMLIIVIKVKSKICNSKLLIAILVSGISYMLFYFPILPCTDYRYFLWSCCTVAITLGAIWI